MDFVTREFGFVFCLVGQFANTLSCVEHVKKNLTVNSNSCMKNINATQFVSATNVLHTSLAFSFFLLQALTKTTSSVRKTHPYGGRGFVVVYLWCRFVMQETQWQCHSIPCGEKVGVVGFLFDLVSFLSCFFRHPRHHHSCYFVARTILHYDWSSSGLEVDATTITRDSPPWTRVHLPRLCSTRRACSVKADIIIVLKASAWSTSTTRWEWWQQWQQNVDHESSGDATKRQRHCPYLAIPRIGRVYLSRTLVHWMDPIYNYNN